MTQGVDLLSHIIQQQSVLGFRQVRRVWLLDDEIRLYDYIDDHLHRYNRLPSFDVLSQNGYLLNQQYPQPLAFYINTVADRYKIGTVRDLSVRMSRIAAAYRPEEINDVHRVLSDALIQGNSSVSVVSLQDMCRQVLEESDAAIWNPMRGYTTGYAIFDEITGGFEPGVHVYVGRINTGKTYFLLDNARKVWQAGAAPLLVSMEMSTMQKARRMLGLHGGVDPKLITLGQLATYGREELEFVVSEMSNRPRFSLMQGGVGRSIADLEATIDAVNPDIIYVDAAYLMKSNESRKYGNRRESIAAVAEATKALSDKVNKPIVCTVQFSREVKTGMSKKSVEKANEGINLGQIGETDVWGQIAINVFGIHPPAKDIASQRQRVIEALKVREGVTNIKIKTNYLFSPPNFDFISVVDNDEDDERVRESNRNLQTLEAIGWDV